MSSAAEVPSDLRFLDAGGEMARLVAGHDWARSPIGPIANWPTSLRTAVGICLSSRHPMVIWWGPELVLIYNDAWIPILGPSKHPALGRPGASVWPEVWHIIGQQMRGVLETGEATWSDDQLLPADRHGYLEEQYFTYSYSAIHDESGGVGGIFTAVTETTSRVLGARRMQTLSELGKVSAAQVRTEDEACRAIVAVLARNRADVPFAAIYLFDHERQALRLVRSTGLISGAADTLLDPGPDGPLWDLQRSGRPLLVDGLRARFERLCLPRGGPVGDAEPDALLAVAISGSGSTEPIGVLATGISPYRALDEDYRAFLGLVAGHVATAIGDARVYDAERRRAQALADLDRAKTDFFSNISHELRMPLTLIAGPAEDSLLDDVDPLPPAQRERVEIIRRNADRLHRLVNDMLDFSRIEGGHLMADLQPTHLAALTRGIVASFAPAVLRTGVGFVVDCPDLDHPVRVDRGMWEKVVLNLLSNALKYTLEGRIVVRLRASDGRVRLDVQDTGVGIPADELPRLFERFHRVRSTAGRSHEGSGIGLALVADLVALHHGSVEVASEEDAGSTFTVWLPYDRPSDPPIHGAGAETAQPALIGSYLEEAIGWDGPDSTQLPAPADPDWGAGDDASPKGTVLVVDDNADLRLMLERLLAPHWTVRVASDGQEALELIAADAPDLVLSDVMMPRLDGIGLLDALRRDPATASIPVILLSARAGEQSAVSGLDAGADDYLVKPFSSVELVARVRANLQLARLREHEVQWRSAVVATMTDGVAILDRAGNAVEINPAFEQITGFAQADAPYAAPHPWWPAAEVSGGAEAARESSTALADAWRDGRAGATLQMSRRDGTAIWVAASLYRVHDPRTGEDMLILTARDVTAERYSEQRARTLARLTAQLAETVRADDVLGVALTELRLTWRGHRVLAASRGARGGLRVLCADETQDATETQWSALAPSTARALQMLLDGGSPHGVVQIGDDAPAPAADQEPGAALTGIGAAVSGSTVIWLELAAPRVLSTDDRALFSVLCDYVGTALERARLFDEQQMVATTLQRSILGPVDQQLPRGVAVRYRPAVRPLEVGGDWYDAIELADGRIGLVVGDCVGRGLKAAAVMGQLRSVTRALLLQAKEPSEVLTGLDAFARHLPGAGCATVFCALVDEGASTLSYSCAGHMPALLCHADGTRELLEEARSLPLAVRDLPRPQLTVALPRDSVLVLYTDGLVERRDEHIDDGMGRLAVAAGHLQAAPVDVLCDFLLERLLESGAGDDDVALVAYRRPASGGAAFRATLPAKSNAVASLRRDLRAWMIDAGAPDDSTEDLVLAVSEACANAVEHAYAFDSQRTIEVVVSHRDGCVDVMIADDAAWKPPHPDCAARQRGRGIPLIRALVDSLSIDTSDGTTIRMAKTLP
jgi:PAS domain S-box-containing protein